MAGDRNASRCAGTRIPAEIRVKRKSNSVDTGTRRGWDVDGERTSRQVWRSRQRRVEVSVDSSNDVRRDDHDDGNQDRAWASWYLWRYDRIPGPQSATGCATSWAWSGDWRLEPSACGSRDANTCWADTHADTRWAPASASSWTAAGVGWRSSTTWWHPYVESSATWQRRPDEWLNLEGKPWGSECSGERSSKWCGRGRSASLDEQPIFGAWKDSDARREFEVLLLGGATAGEFSGVKGEGANSDNNGAGGHASFDWAMSTPCHGFGVSTNSAERGLPWVGTSKRSSASVPHIGGSSSSVTQAIGRRLERSLLLHELRGASSPCSGPVATRGRSCGVVEGLGALRLCGGGRFLLPPPPPHRAPQPGEEY